MVYTLQKGARVHVCGEQSADRQQALHARPPTHSLRRAREAAAQRLTTRVGGLAGDIYESKI